jgi:Beta-ketoacyl synthase, N-terminal domain
VVALTGLAVRAWYAWAPGMDTQRAWLQWAGAGSAAGGVFAGNSVHDVVRLPALPMMLRRRATSLGQKILMAALALGETVQTGRYILASRHGEFSRQVGILDALASAESPSPAEFTMSVHNALAGLLSIHTGNTQGHTAIAAGADTFAMALLEAVACLQEKPADPVLLLYGDEQLPPPFDVYGETDTAEPLVAAFALASPRPGEVRIVTEITHDHAGHGASGCMARDFLRFLLSESGEGRSTSERISWSWRRAA